MSLVSCLYIHTLHIASILHTINICGIGVLVFSTSFGIVIPFLRYAALLAPFLIETASDQNNIAKKSRVRSQVPTSVTQLHPWKYNGHSLRILCVFNSLLRIYTSSTARGGARSFKKVKYIQNRRHCAYRIRLRLVEHFPFDFHFPFDSRATPF